MWPFSSPCMIHTCTILATCQSRDPVARLFLSAYFLSFLHTLPLHNSHLNTKYLIAKLQANLARNKAYTWLNKFNLTSCFNVWTYVSSIIRVSIWVELKILTFNSSKSYFIYFNTQFHNTSYINGLIFTISLKLFIFLLILKAWIYAKTQELVQTPN